MDIIHTTGGHVQGITSFLILNTVLPSYIRTITPTNLITKEITFGKKGVTGIQKNTIHEALK